MHRALVVLIMSALGCVQPDVVHCADGRVCPGGTTCTAFGACALPSQVEACNGLADGDPCTYPGVVAGACREGICIPAGCGNGVREITEACDDGNTIANDGCSSDCRSNELCGDGATDTALGETCDDGNHLSHDGCSSACRVEQYAVRSRVTGPPDGRRGHAMVYDAARGRVVMFSGTAAGNVRFGETWEWDGTTWTRLDPPVSPVARQGHAMAYDPVRGRVILFGGLASSRLFDTWEWNGSTWRELPMTNPPSGRYGHAMAFDGNRGRVVLVGGTTTLDVEGDAFELVDDTWVEIVTPTALPPRSGHAMAFDPIRGQLVVTGGAADAGMVGYDDAWALDASDWVQLPAPGTPRIDGVATFDPPSGQLLVFGGTPDGIASKATSTTIAWNGTAWSPVSSATLPPARSQAAMTFDVRRGLVVLFGGYLTDFAYAQDTWTWTNASRWVVHTAPAPQFSLGQQALGWDPDRGSIRSFGGRVANFAFTDEHWEWSGGWRPSITQPPARGQAHLAHDGTGMLLVGGTVSDTWHFASTWTARGAGAPADLRGSALTGAPGGGLLVYGGSRAGDTDEVWRWDGGWAQLGAGPPARRRHAMAFDPIRNRVVMYGGTFSLDPLSELWEFDGTSWTQLAPAGREPVDSHIMVFDPNRRAIMVVSANLGESVGAAWDGTTWTPLALPLPPAGLGTVRAVYDARHRGIVWLAAAAQNTSPIVVTSLELSSSTPDEACSSGLDLDGDGLVGCADPDCWPFCTPRCSPGMQGCATTGPRCGDGTCNTALEDCGLCPSDCGTCPDLCGDFQCTAGETAASCPGDC